LLLTDVGYEHRPEYVWEKLTEIDGDTMCCNSMFTQSRNGASRADQVTTSVVSGTVVGMVGGGKTSDGELILSGTVVASHSAAATGDAYMAQKTTGQHEDLSQFMTPQELEHQRSELARLKQQQGEKLRQQSKAGTRKAKNKSSCIIS